METGKTTGGTSMNKGVNMPRITLELTALYSLFNSDASTTDIARATDVNRTTVTQYRKGKGLEHMTVGTALRLQAYAIKVGAYKRER